MRSSRSSRCWTRRRRLSERDALTVALRALTPRERSRRDVDERLARAGFGADDREAALAELERLGYLDDRRFAAARAGALAGRGYGDAWIRHDLAEHGVDGELAEDAVAELVPEAERAAAGADGAVSGPRLAARLRRRGFGEAAIEAAAGPVFADPADGA